MKCGSFACIIPGENLALQQIHLYIFRGGGGGENPSPRVNVIIGIERGIIMPEVISVSLFAVLFNSGYI